MGLEVAVQDAVGMTATDSGNDLSQKGAHRGYWQADPLGNVLRVLTLVHKTLEIVLDEFKDQIESIRLGLNDIKQFDLTYVRDAIIRKENKRWAGNKIELNNNKNNNKTRTTLG